MQYRAQHVELIFPYALTGIVLIVLLTGFAVCHNMADGLLQPLPETQRVSLRSVFYLLAILLFPLTNLLRHVFIRLNQTMPLAINKPAHNVAKKRYLLTHVISLLLMSSVGIFGFVLFAYGDGFTTLNIFIGLSVLGLFLYRPKLDEYNSIVKALTAQRSQ
jgi:MFS family permease